VIQEGIPPRTPQGNDPGRDTTENTTVLRGKHEKYAGRPGRRDSNQGRSCYYHSFIREDSHSSVVSFGQTPQLTEENAVITADIIGGESHISFERGVQFREPNVRPI